MSGSRLRRQFLASWVGDRRQMSTGQFRVAERHARRSTQLDSIEDARPSTHL